MSNLIAVAYDDVHTARYVLATLSELSLEHAIALDDAVLVQWGADGRITLDQTSKRAGVASAGGALWGALIGPVFLAPLLRGSLTEVGVDDGFLLRLGEDLQPGTVAVFVLMHDSTPDRILPQISPFGGRVLHTSLSDETEARLRALRARIPRGDPYAGRVRKVATAEPPPSYVA